MSMCIIVRKMQVLGLMEEFFGFFFFSVFVYGKRILDIQIAKKKRRIMRRSQRKHENELYYRSTPFFFFGISPHVPSITKLFVVISFIHLILFSYFFLCFLFFTVFSLFIFHGTLICSCERVFLVIQMVYAHLKSSRACAKLFFAFKAYCLLLIYDFHFFFFLP